jgi:hypothetical protein
MAERRRRCNAAVPAKSFTPEAPTSTKSRRPRKSIPEEPVYTKGKPVFVEKLSIISYILHSI